MKKIISIIIAVLCVFIAVCAVQMHNFTPEGWSSDREHRHLMIKDLEREYNISDMTEDEIIALLGEPDSVVSSEEAQSKVLGYYIESGTVDPVFYEICLKDGAVTKTQKIEH